MQCAIDVQHFGDPAPPGPTVLFQWRSTLQPSWVDNACMSALVGQWMPQGPRITDSQGSNPPPHSSPILSHGSRITPPPPRHPPLTHTHCLPPQIFRTTNLGGQAAAGAENPQRATIANAECCNCEQWDRHSDPTHN